MQPPPLPSTAQEAEDQNHLKLLAIFHYVMAGLLGFFACIPFIHLSFGIILIVNPDFMNQGKPNDVPAWLGYMVVIVAVFILLFAWGIVYCTYLAGRFIAQRRHWTYSIVVAACLTSFMPIGTALGIFTIIVLNRDSVKKLYADGQLRK